MADPVIIADINANGLVQANDTSQVQRLILNVGSPFVPNRPAGSNTAAGLDPQLFITTSTASASPGDTITMSLNRLLTEGGYITFGDVTFKTAASFADAVSGWQYAADYLREEDFTLEALWVTLSDTQNALDEYHPGDPDQYQADAIFGGDNCDWYLTPYSKKT